MLETADTAIRVSGDAPTARSQRSFVPPHVAAYVQWQEPSEGSPSAGTLPPLDQTNRASGVRSSAGPVGDVEEGAKASPWRPAVAELCGSWAGVGQVRLVQMAVTLLMAPARAGSRTAAAHRYPLLASMSSGSMEVRIAVL